MAEEDGVQAVGAISVATVVFAHDGVLLSSDEVAGVQVAVPSEPVAVLVHDARMKERRMISARIYCILPRTEYLENTSALLEMIIFGVYTPRNRIIAQS